MPTAPARPSATRRARGARADRVFTAEIAAVRRFTRFFTSLVGVLEDHYLHSPFTVTEARVLYELAHGRDVAAVDLVRELRLDAGYVSRVLADFEQRGLVRRTRAEDDARRTIVQLTAAGSAAFAPLDTGANELVASLLGPLAPGARRTVAAAMDEIERLLTPGVSPARARSARRETGRSR